MSAVNLCIDFQSQYPKQEGCGYNYFWPELKTNIVNTIDSCAAVGIPTIYIAMAQYKNADYMYKAVRPFSEIPCNLFLATKQSDLWFDLPLKRDALVAFKRQYSSFEEPALVDYVTKAGFSKIICCGLFEAKEPDVFEKEVRKSRTAKDFASAGFEVAIAAEATPCAIQVLGDTFYRPLQTRQKIHDPIGVKVAPLNEILNGFGFDVEVKETKRFWGINFSEGLPDAAEVRSRMMDKLYYASMVVRGFYR